MTNAIAFGNLLAKTRRFFARKSAVCIHTEDRVGSERCTDGVNPFDFDIDRVDPDLQFEDTESVRIAFAGLVCILGSIRVSKKV